MKVFVVSIIGDPTSVLSEYILGVYNTFSEARECVNDYMNTHNVILCGTEEREHHLYYTLYYEKEEENYYIAIEEIEQDG